MIVYIFFALLAVRSLVCTSPEPLGKDNIRNYIEKVGRRPVEHEDHTHVDSEKQSNFHPKPGSIYDRETNSHEGYENGEAKEYTPPHQTEKTLTPVRRIDDTKVDCLKTHMVVTIKFSTPFNGFVYPHEHFLKCILFYGKNSREATLTLHHGNCGLRRILNYNEIQFSPVIEHRLVIQWERDFMCEDDSSIIVRCDRPDDFNKTIAWNFRAKELASSYMERNTRPGPRISMEIRRGEGPNAPPLDEEPVFLGDVLTVVFTISDEVFWFGSNILSCNAIDGGDSDENVRKVDKYSQTSSSFLGRMTVVENECSTKPKIFSHFFKEKITTKEGNLVTLHYAHMKAFRFPTSHKVVLQCDVQVCYKKCDPLPACSVGFQPRAETTKNRQRRETLNSPNEAGLEEGDELNTVLLYKTIEVFSAEDGALKEVPVTSVLSAPSDLAEPSLECFSSQTFYSWIAALSAAIFFLSIVIIWYVIKPKMSQKIYDVTTEN